MQHRVIKKYPDLNPEDFCLAIDDTDNPKFGSGVFRVGDWHSSKGHYYGQRVVILVLVDIKRKIASPLSYRIAAKEGQAGFATAKDLAMEMLSEIKNEKFPNSLKVVCDSWFDGVEFVKNVRRLGFHIVWELKSNRNVWPNPGRWVQVVKLPSLFKIKLERD